MENYDYPSFFVVLLSVSLSTLVTVLWFMAFYKLSIRHFFAAIIVNHVYFVFYTLLGWEKYYIIQNITITIKGKN